MSTEFEFGTANESIQVRVTGFDASHEKEGVVKTLDSTVSIHIGAFSGSFNAAFTTQDLTVLYEHLSSALTSPSGKVSFKNTGGDLSLSIELNDAGRAIVTGVIQPHRLPQGILHFRFDIAQSDLTTTLEQLHNTLRKYPINKIAHSAG